MEYKKQTLHLPLPFSLCRGDWLLKFLYRTASVQYTIAGLMAIEWEDRRMNNIDLTDVVSAVVRILGEITLDH